MAITRHVRGMHVVAVCGGLDANKQIRLLGKRPDVVIATPGRLWELVDRYEVDHVSRLQTLRYFLCLFVCLLELKSRYFVM